MFFYLRFFLMLLYLVGACLVSLLLCLVYWKNPDVMSKIGRVLSWGPMRIFNQRVEVKGLEHLRTQPAICVGNHQSGYDVMIYGTFVPGHSVSVGKKELLWIPFFGLVFLGSGSLMIDRKDSKGAMASLEQALRRAVEQRLSIVIFPEGTRNRSGIGMLPFKRGAFHLAIQAQIPVIPIVLPRVRDWMDWRKGFAKSGVIPVQVLEPIPTKSLGRMDVQKLGDLVRARMLEAQAHFQRPRTPDQ